MMDLGMTESISGAGYAAESSDSDTTLGKDDFLKLLITQMQNQDPLEPVDNKDLVLQLAQFSTLEGTQNLNSNLEDFIGSSGIQTASSMIGKQVGYLDMETMTPSTGIVNKIDVYGGEAYLMVNGQSVRVKDILSIQDAPPPATSSPLEPSSN